MNKALTTVAAPTDPRELALLKAVGLDRVSAEQRELAMNIAARYELDLLLKHIVMIDGRPYITRDGLLHIAHRSGQLDGIEATEPAILDGFWRASCSVYRKDMSRPFTYTGRYPTSGGNQKFAPEMATKVAEVMALRRAFDVSAPVAEERWDLEATPAPESASRAAPSLAERVAEKAAAVAQPEVEGEATEVDDTLDGGAWSWERVRATLMALPEERRPRLGQIIGAATELWPDKGLALHEPKAWPLTSAEWQQVADAFVAEAVA